MTYRERRQRRIERLQEWAGKREDRSTESFNRAHEMVDPIPSGQPILIGHHSERAHRKRLEQHDTAMRQGFEHQAKADSIASRAGNIADQLDRSIYSDDPDAIAQLERRIAELEAERDGIKAYNVSCRKGEPDAYVAPLNRRSDIGGRFMAKDGTFPPYVLSNLSGNINRNKKRLAILKRNKYPEVS